MTKNRKVVLIIQARMGSTRFPGKVLKKILGMPLLAFQIERLRRVSNVDEIILATTKLSRDDVIEELCHELKVECFRGSEEDVLSRYFEIAKKKKADVIVRSTGDCPLIDPQLVDHAIALLLEHEGVDYVSNTLKRTFPRGLDIEVFTFRVLREAMESNSTKEEQEHVTSFMTSRSKRYNLQNFTNPEDPKGNENLGSLRWTVDYPKDMEFIKKVYEELYPNDSEFGWLDVLTLIRNKPEISKINQSVG